MIKFKLLFIFLIFLLMPYQFYCDSVIETPYSIVKKYSEKDLILVFVKKIVTNYKDTTYGFYELEFPSKYSNHFESRSDNYFHIKNEMVPEKMTLEHGMGYKLEYHKADILHNDEGVIVRKLLHVYEGGELSDIYLYDSSGKIKIDYNISIGSDFTGEIPISTNNKYFLYPIFNYTDYDGIKIISLEKDTIINHLKKIDETISVPYENIIFSSDGNHFLAYDDNIEGRIKYLSDSKGKILWRTKKHVVNFDKDKVIITENVSDSILFQLSNSE